MSVVRPPQSVTHTYNMKLLVFCFILCLVAWLGSSSPIDPKRQLVNRPKIFKRSPQMYGVVYVKGQRPQGREYNPTPLPHLRKGQYMCGNKVCKLQPGEIPKGCNGMCQYAV